MLRIACINFRETEHLVFFMIVNEKRDFYVSQRSYNKRVAPVYKRKRGQKQNSDK